MGCRKTPAAGSAESRRPPQTGRTENRRRNPCPGSPAIGPTFRRWAGKLPFRSCKSGLVGTCARAAARATSTFCEELLRQVADFRRHIGAAAERGGMEAGRGFLGGGAIAVRQLGLQDRKA